MAAHELDNMASPSTRPLLGVAGSYKSRSSNSDKDDDAHRGLRRKLGAAFFCLGLLNNVLYVIILSAALDLVPANVPKGIVLFANIFPALLAKLGWPYLIPGRVRYSRRIVGCSLLSFLGILLVAASSGLSLRLFGIALASFSSGLGEMTYLQRTTVYGDDEHTKLAVGWFSSGTGAAGLVGAALWWELRAFGVKIGLGISSVLPVCMALVYFLLLPASNAFKTSQTHQYLSVPNGESSDQRAETSHSHGQEDDDVVDDTEPLTPSLYSEARTSITKPRLTTRAKLELAKPLFVSFMIPLFVVYFAEYTVNTGVSPTLVYPIPDSAKHPVLAGIINSLSDYYPLWQLVYQTFVFFSRSSIVIFRVPPLPPNLIPLPSMLQFGVLLLAVLESTRSIFTAIFGPDYAIVACAVLIASEGLFGGLAYVNVFLRVGLIDDDATSLDEQQMDRRHVLARREFRIACVGFADTFGIVAASFLSSWLEPTLCQYQVDHGRLLCREVKS